MWVWRNCIDVSSPEGVAFRVVNAQRLNGGNCVTDAGSDEDAWNQTLALAKSPVNGPDAIVLEGYSPIETETCIPAIAAVSKILFETADRLDISVESQADGWLMVSNTWYPGWKAYVDGKEMPVLRADYLFMAVTVPQGQHQVSLVYQPESFSIGSILVWPDWPYFALLSSLSKDRNVGYH